MMNLPMLGVFDSGFGGLTILKAIHERFPNLSTIYFGDNANAPYGTRAHEEIFDLTWRGVKFLFDHGCPLVILACNSASAQALRQIQQTVLEKEYPARRVLGIIRPTVEFLAETSRDKHMGVLGTPATVSSNAYKKEFAHLGVRSVTQIACPGLVELIERGEHDSPEANKLVHRYVSQCLALDPHIDTTLLGCTHYPLLLDIFFQHTPPSVQLVTQGTIVANKLTAYLDHHPDMANLIERNGQRLFYTSTSSDISPIAARFFGSPIKFIHTSMIDRTVFL